MPHKIVLIILMALATYSHSIAQNVQFAHQLTQSCYVTDLGKIVVNAGGQYTTAVSQQVFLRDSLHESIYDTVSNTFKNSKRYYYSYDSGGLVTEALGNTIDKSGTIWSRSQLLNYKYTSFHLYEETFKNWDKSLLDWVNSSKNKYSYETDNSLSSIFYMPWSSADTLWEYSNRDLITYDQNMNVTSIANQKWNKNLGSWDNYMRINFTYSGGYISQKLYQAYNSNTFLWDDYQKESFTYTANQKTEVITQVKSGTADWGNYSRNVLTYETHGISTNTEYLWSGAWNSNRKFTYTYIDNNLPSLVLTQKWAANLGAYRNQSQSESFYTMREVFGVSETPSSSILVNNPISKQSAFQLRGLKENTAYQMKLISVNGSTVFNMPVANGQSISLGSQVKNGIYMLVFSAKGMKSLSQKILITD